jgi:hypothetical protein
MGNSRGRAVKPTISSGFREIADTYLDQELVSPTIKRLEALGAIDIIDQNTTVCSSVESDTERLESFLTGGIP